MKDSIEFPVVGTRFSEGGLLMARLLEVGSILELVPEPENPKDPYAIKIMAFRDEHIGYVPNQGMSCKNCWSPVKPDSQYCDSCNANWDQFIQGGLATRIVKSDSLSKDHGCFVIRMDKQNEYAPVIAKLIIG